MVREAQNAEIDERGTLAKVAAGNLGVLDAADFANVAQVATGFAANNPIFGAANVAVSGVAGELEAGKERQKIARLFSDGDMRRAKDNPAVRAKLNELDDRWKGSMLESAIVVGGGALLGLLIGPIIGGLLGTFAIPIPFFGSIGGAAIGGFIGLVGGGIIASTVYDGFIKDQAQDPLLINEQIIKLHESGQPVPPELVFAALAGNLSGKAGERTDKILDKYTGTKYFHEAMGEEKNMSKLTTMMHNPTIDNAIRAQTLMPPDDYDPTKPVAQQYAELINSGRLNPKDILRSGAGMYALPPVSNMRTAANSQGAEAPATPMRVADAGMIR